MGLAEHAAVIAWAFLMVGHSADLLMVLLLANYTSLVLLAVYLELLAGAYLLAKDRPRLG